MKIKQRTKTLSNKDKLYKQIIRDYDYIKHGLWKAVEYFEYGHGSEKGLYDNYKGQDYSPYKLYLKIKRQLKSLGLKFSDHNPCNGGKWQIDHKIPKIAGCNSNYTKQIHSLKNLNAVPTHINLSKNCKYKGKSLRKISL